MKHLIHRTRGFGTTGNADYFRRHPRNGDVVRHRFDDDRAGGDPSAMPDLDIAEDFGAGADHHAITNFRMPVAGLFASAAKRHVVQHGDVVIDHRRLADDEPRGMVQENPPPDLGRRMNIALKHRRGTALQIEREIVPPLAP